MLRKMSGLVLCCLFCVSVCGSVRFSVVRVACCTSFDRQRLRFPSQSVSSMSEYAEPARNDPLPNEAAPPTTQTKCHFVQRNYFMVVRRLLKNTTE